MHGVPNLKSYREVCPQDRGSRSSKNAGTHHIPEDSNFVDKNRVPGL